MAFHILDEVRKKPRSDWNKLIRERWTRTRIWIQENGEAAFVLGLAIGFLVVVFNKLFIALIALAIIIGCSIYLISPEEDFTVEGDAVQSKSESEEDVDKDGASSAEEAESPPTGPH